MNIIDEILPSLDDHESIKKNCFPAPGTATLQFSFFFAASYIYS